MRPMDWLNGAVMPERGKRVDTQPDVCQGVAPTDEQETMMPMDPEVYVPTTSAERTAMDARMSRIDGSVGCAVPTGARRGGDRGPDWGGTATSGGPVVDPCYATEYREPA